MGVDWAGKYLSDSKVTQGKIDIVTPGRQAPETPVTTGFLGMCMRSLVVNLNCDLMIVIVRGTIATTMDVFQPRPLVSESESEFESSG